MKKLPSASPCLAAILFASLLAFLPAAMHASDAPALPDDSTWSLVELNGKPVQTEEAPTLRFEAAKGQVDGFAGVNRYFGGYERTGERLKFGALGSTRMAGPPERMDLETSFLAMLAGITAWRIEEGKLTLLNGGEVAARFAILPADEK